MLKHWSYYNFKFTMLIVVPLIQLLVVLYCWHVINFYVVKFCVFMTAIAITWKAE